VTEKTHYEVLEVSRTATEDEIKKAYRQLAMRYHPDQAGTPEDTDKFIRISEAYEALIDAPRRESYDRILELDKKLQEERRRRKAQPNSTNSPKTAKPAAPKIEEVGIPQPPPGPAPKGPPTKANVEDILKLTSLSSRGRDREAERLARRLVISNVNSPIPFAVLGDICRKKGDLDECSRLYSLALQIDPKNIVYIRKYEEVNMLRSSKGANGKIFRGVEEDESSLATFLMIFTVLMSMVFIASARERAIFSEYPIISTYTIGLISMQAISGLGIGAGLASSKMIDRPQAASQIAISVSMLAIFNFWIAAFAFLIMSGFRRILHVTTARLVLGIAIGSICLAGASLVNPIYDFSQVLLWSGNLMFIAAMIGWFTADSVMYPS
jgi:hypothetical protein